MRRRILVILGTLATLAGAVALLPVVVKHYAEGWLRDQGMPEAGIEDLDINPFTGELILTGLDLGGSAEQRAQLDYLLVNVEMLALLRAQVEASVITLRGARLDTSRSPTSWEIGPFRLETPTQDQVPATESDPPAWGFGFTSLTVEDVALSHSEPGFAHAAVVDRIRVGPFATWAPDAVTHLLADVETDSGSLALEGTVTPLAAEPAFNASMGVADLAIERSGYRATMEQLQLNASGTAAPAPDGSSPRVSGTFAVTMDDFALNSSEPGLTWLNIAALEIAEGRIAGLEDIAIGRLTLAQLQALGDAERPDSVVGFEALTASELSLHGFNILRIADLSIRDLNLHLHRNGDGTFAVLSTALARLEPPLELQGGAASAPAPSEPDAPGSPFAFAIETLDIGGNSAVSFADDATDPAFSTTVAIERLNVQALGNVDGESPAQLSLTLREGEQTRLTIAGTTLPFSEALSADLKVSLEDFDLHKISPYLPAYHIERGRLSAESVVAVTAGELNVSNDLTVDKLKLAGKTEDENALAAQGMAMPLDVALDLLRDSDDRISLTLPVTGNVADPTVDTGDIVRTAIQSAVQKAALSYVKNALQPLGTILLVARVAGSAARPRFEPIEFVPGTSELPARAERYLEKIGDLMTQRGALQLTVCGVATGQDHAALLSRMAPPPPSNADTALDGATDAAADAAPSVDESLLIELAEARGAAVRGYLGRIDSVDPERLFACRPTYETAGDALPRVEVTL